VRFWPGRARAEVSAPRAEWVVTEQGEPEKSVSVMVPGVPGKRHCLTLISASFNQHSWSGYLTLLWGGRKRLQWYVHNGLDLPLRTPIEVGVGETVTLYLHVQTPRQIPPGLSGVVNLAGFTEDG
jgi:hypothetical protein